MLTLADIIEALCHTRPGKSGFPIRKVITDSRQASSNALFVAMPGDQTNGHIYIGDAFHHGARLALVERDVSHLYPTVDIRDGIQGDDLSFPQIPFCLRVESVINALADIARLWRIRQNPHVIAVAGSSQDTAVHTVLTEILSPRYPALYFRASQSTEAELCQALLHMEKSGQRIIVDFQGCSAALIKRLVSLVLPQVALLSGCNHNDRLDLSAGEQALVDELSPSSVAVLAYDCVAEYTHSHLIAAQPFFYGLDSEADLWASGIESHGMEGVHFWLHFNGESNRMSAPLIGHHSIHIALQAAAVGLNDGLSWHDIAAGLKRSSGQLRLVTLPSESGALILDDSYNFTPESTLAALNLLDRFEGRKVAVFGAFPEDSSHQDGSQMVGGRAAEVVQELVTVGEQASPIAEAAEHAGLASQAITWVRTSQEAVDYLRVSLRKDDMVLVKGDGEGSMRFIVSEIGVSV